MARRPLRALPAAALFAVLLFVFVAGLCLRPMAESDLFFRLAAGREILRRHGLPGTNLFSFTYPDYPNLDTAWLFEVGAVVLHRLGGFPALVLAKTLIVLAAFGVAYRLCRARGAGALASVAALAAAGFAGHERFVERPHLFSLLGEVAILSAIDTLAGQSPRPVRAGGLAIASVVVWANLHAGVFVAPMLLLLAALGAGAERHGGSAARLAFTAVGAAAATLATPVGFGIVHYLRLHLRLPALHPVDEFRPPSWTSDAPLIVFALVTALAMTVAALADRPQRPRWQPLLPVGGLGFLALRSVRFGADFALAAAPLLAVALTSVGRRLRPVALRNHFPVDAVATSLLVGLLAGATFVPRLAGTVPPGLGLDTRELPLGALAFVDAHGLRDRMYNDFEIGAYLIFDPVNGYPRHRVFVDPRLPAYPEEMHRVLGRADVSRDEWAAAMDGYGIESALLAYAGINRRVAWWDPERWALVFREGDARVFVRRLPRHLPLIAAREIPATFTFSLEEGTATVPLVARPSASPVPECQWHSRLGDLSFELDGAASPRVLAAYDAALSAPSGCLSAADDARLSAWRAAVALAAGEGTGALAMADRALAHGDRDVSTLSNRALALEMLGRRGEAAAAWGRVAERAPGTALEGRARERAERLGR